MPLQNRRTCVLIVANAGAYQAIALAVIEAYGHEGVVAEGSAQAHALTETKRFSLVMVDVDCLSRDVTSWLARMLGSRHRAVRPPVIVLASALGDDMRSCLLTAGVDDLVVGPPSAGKVMDSVAKYLHSFDPTPGGSPP